MVRFIPLIAALACFMTDSRIICLRDNIKVFIV
jgi:hypothetical protein